MLFFRKLSVPQHECSGDFTLEADTTVYIYLVGSDEAATAIITGGRIL